MTLMTPPGQEDLARLQKEWGELQERVTAALATGAELLRQGRFSEAEEVNRQAREGCDTFLRAWREQLPPEGAAWLQALTQELRAGLWWQQSQICWHEGRLSAARETAELALGLCEDRPGPTLAGLRQWLGGLCQHLESFEEAEAHYLRAKEEYARQAREIAGRPELQEFAPRLWQEAARSLSLAAHNALAQGKRQEFVRYMDEALALARAQELTDVHRELWLTKWRYRLDTDPSGEALAEAREELATIAALAQDPETRVELLSLEAQSLMERGAPRAAKRRLQAAVSQAHAFPLRQCGLLMQLAHLSETEGDPGEAITFLEEALALARKNVPAMVTVLLARLIPLRVATGEDGQQAAAARELEEIRAQGGGADLALALLGRAGAHVQAGHLEPALQDLEAAKSCAPTWEQRCQIWLAQAAALGRAGRQEEALQANREARALLQEHLQEVGRAEAAAWKTTLGQLQGLYTQAAYLTAGRGEVRQALELAEEGKAVGLSGQLARAGLTPAPLRGATAGRQVEELYRWLAPEKAALLMYCLSERGTLALVAEPEHPEPRACFLPLTETELGRLLPSQVISEQATAELFAPLPELSRRLLWPLGRRFHRCRVLYIIPDARLACLPFGALSWEDGTFLAETCPLAWAPSLAVLHACRSRARPPGRRSCLALGAGGAGGVSFAAQAREISQLGWEEARCLPEATSVQFFQEAPRYSTLHLACHGRLEESLFGTLSASQLELADRRVTARDIYARPGFLSADLVFLNACTSGRVVTRPGAEIGGFWEAFLLAGAASLIATLTFVEPVQAQELATAFYHHWLKGGVSKAEALHRAQLDRISHGVEPRHWASHILIGDDR